MERLQRVLAAAGIASRRKAEDLIREGRVRVDGQVVTELGTRVDAMSQKIEVDGNLIPQERRRYIMLHKPSGYITTTDDERGRYTVMDLVQITERVVPVGRLDRPTEGLLLLTNDGEVAYRVTHPRFGVEKEYEALLDGHPPARALERVRNGIVIDGERTVPEMVRPLRNTDDGTLVRIVIHEGRNRIVRRMFEEIGFPVLKLVRTRIGPLQLGSIPRGQWRDLSDGELEQLREALNLDDEDLKDEARERRPHWTERRPQPQGQGTRGPRRDDRAGGGMDRHGERRMMPRRDQRDQRDDRGGQQWRPAAGGPRREQGGFGQDRDQRDPRGPRQGFQRGPFTPERRDDRRPGGPPQQRGPAPRGQGQGPGEQRWDRPPGPRNERDGQRNVRQWSGPSDQRPMGGPPSDQRGRHVNYGPGQERPRRDDRDNRGPRRDGPGGPPRGPQSDRPRNNWQQGGPPGPRRDDAPRGPRPQFAQGQDRERSFDRGFERGGGPRPFQGGPRRDERGPGAPGGPGGERRDWRPRDDRSGGGPGAPRFDRPRDDRPGGGGGNWQRNDAPRGQFPAGERRDGGDRRPFRDDARGGQGPRQWQDRGPAQGQNRGPNAQQGPRQWQDRRPEQGQGQGRGPSQGPGAGQPRGAQGQWQDRDQRQAEGRWNANPARRPLGQRNDGPRDAGQQRGPWRPAGDAGQREHQAPRPPQPNREQQSAEPRGNQSGGGRSLRRQGGGSGDGGRQWKLGNNTRGPRRTERGDGPERDTTPE